jgi:hypothetical protein
MKQKGLIAQVSPPSYLLPKNLGLNWDMIQPECESVLNLVAKKSSPTYLLFEFQLNNNTSNFYCFFSKQGKLNRINVDLLVSRDFWDEHDEQKREVLVNDYQKAYEELTVHYGKELGEPFYSGTWGDKSYPQHQYAWRLSFWQLEKDIFQVELDHPDKEYPVVVRVSWYPEID